METLTFEQVVKENNNLAYKKFNKEIHTWQKYCKEGNLDVIKWFTKNKYTYYPAYIITAAKHGHLEIVKYLHEIYDKNDYGYAFDVATV